MSGRRNSLRKRRWEHEMGTFNPNARTVPSKALEYASRTAAA
jgi:hypothetical protein